jgi:hypothetical protein
VPSGPNLNSTPHPPPLCELKKINHYESVLVHKQNQVRLNTCYKPAIHMGKQKTVLDILRVNKKGRFLIILELFQLM